MKRVGEYIETWKRQGYSDDIPDEVPDALLKDRLAPSYKAIAMSILKSDLQFVSLGFAAKVSSWYGELKRMEIAERPQEVVQMRLFP